MLQSEEVPVFDIKVIPESKFVVQSCSPISFHVDAAYSPAPPRLVAWRCVGEQPATILLLSAVSLRILLLESGYNSRQLEEARLIFLFGDEHLMKPLFRYRDGDLATAYSPFRLIEAHAPNTDGSLLTDLAKATRPDCNEGVRIELNQGDWLVIDNEQVLHGRPALEESSGRHLKRMYFH